MRQEKWLLMGLFLVFSACSSGNTDAPSGGNGSDAQAGAGGSRGNLDARAAADVPTTPRPDSAVDVPSVPSGCSSSLECSGRADNLKICSVPTRECVECLTSSDCAPGTDASLPGRECVKNACVTRPACTNSLDCQVGNVCDRTSGVCVQCVANTDCTADHICAAGTCRKKCVSDIECTPLGLLCETRLGYCSACVLDTDCPASQFCSQGECLRDVCVAGTTKCQNNTVATCNAAGSGWISPVACKTNQSCRDTGSAGICMDRVCTPSAKTCSTEGEKAVSCSADGLTSTVLEDCAASGKVCAAGACATAVCTPGARFCQGVEVRQCSAKGESSTLVSTCTTAQYCDGASNTCKAKVCQPNQPACKDTVATTCDAVGAATLPGGTDCAVQGLICSQGKCQTYVCTASSIYCDLGTVRQCSADGLSSTLVSTCTASQYCDKGSCKAQVCQPNQPMCSGTNGKFATTCNADGSGYSPDGIDCSLNNQGCAVGLCKDLVCTPSTYFCQDNNVRYCNTTGLSSSVYDPCTTSEYCDATNRICKTRVCTPGAAVCSGNILTVCKDDGSGPATGGTACPTGKTCDVGQCKDQVCTPSTYFCKENAVYYCDAKGLSSSSYTPCTEKQYCDAVNRTCKLRICTPSLPACTSNNVVGTCNADGSGFVADGNDCAALAQVCSAAACAASAVDTIDPSPTVNEYSSSSYTSTRLNFYSVTSARTLTQIEQYLNAPTGVTLTWSVYSGSSKASGATFTRILTKTSAGVGAAGYASSGEISVALLPGTYYAIAVTWNSSTNYTAYWYHTSGYPVTTSFGALENGYYSSTTAGTTTTYPTSATSYYYPQRLTTVPYVAP